MNPNDWHFWKIAKGDREVALWYEIDRTRFAKLGGVDATSFVKSGNDDNWLTLPESRRDVIREIWQKFIDAEKEIPILDAKREFFQQHIMVEPPVSLCSKNNYLNSNGMDDAEKIGADCREFTFTINFKYGSGVIHEWLDIVVANIENSIEDEIEARQIVAKSPNRKQYKPITFRPPAVSRKGKNKALDILKTLGYYRVWNAAKGTGERKLDDARRNWNTEVERYADVEFSDKSKKDAKKKSLFVEKWKFDHKIKQRKISDFAKTYLR